jgi:hypothetical protein
MKFDRDLVYGCCNCTHAWVVLSAGAGTVHRNSLGVDSKALCIYMSRTRSMAVTTALDTYQLSCKAGQVASASQCLVGVH